MVLPAFSALAVQYEATLNAAVPPEITGGPTSWISFLLSCWKLVQGCSKPSQKWKKPGQKKTSETGKIHILLLTGLLPIKTT